MFWSNLWSSITAIGTFALALATFFLIIRDRQLVTEQKKPFPLFWLKMIQKPSRGDSERYGMYFQVELKVSNLGQFPIQLYRLDLKTTDGKSSIRSLDLQTMIPPYSIKQEELRITPQGNTGNVYIYFVYGPTGTGVHRVSIPFKKGDGERLHQFNNEAQRLDMFVGKVS